MEFVILGAGALGSIFTAFLTRGGHDVTLIARGDRARQISDYGIQVTGQDDFTTCCKVVDVSNASDIKHTDVLIVAVKTYHTDDALASLAGLQTDAAFSIQNGVQKNEQLAAVFGSDAVLGAVSMVGGALAASPESSGLSTTSPATVRYTFAADTIIGGLKNTQSASASRIVDAFTTSGLGAVASDRIQTVEWSKFIHWSGLSAVAVLTRLHTYKFLSDADSALIVARVMRETAAVAQALNIPVEDTPPPMLSKTVAAGSEADAVQALQNAGEKFKAAAPDLRQSILQDADRGRPLEINETLGYTVKRAAEFAIPVPTLDLCCRILGTVSRNSTAA